MSKNCFDMSGHRMIWDAVTGTVITVGHDVCVDQPNKKNKSKSTTK